MVYGLGRAGFGDRRHPSRVSGGPRGGLLPGVATLATMNETTSKSGRWICDACGWIYDPAEGDPDGGIPAGTPFEEIPEGWFCPVCGATKEDFSPYED